VLDLSKAREVTPNGNVTGKGNCVAQVGFGINVKSRRDLLLLRADLQFHWFPARTTSIFVRQEFLSHTKSKLSIASEVYYLQSDLRFPFRTTLSQQITENTTQLRIYVGADSSSSEYYVDDFTPTGVFFPARLHFIRRIGKDIR
jgi:hypothetical protein